MRMLIPTTLALVGGLLLGACNQCIGKGKNGVPPPAEGEFQLVFSNIVSRETVLYVDGQKAGEVCEETEYATVGNFPVSENTSIKIHSMLSGEECYISPNCSSDCSSQSCDGDAVLDTTPYSGRIYNTGFIWRM